MKSKLRKLIPLEDLNNKSEYTIQLAVIVILVLLLCTLASIMISGEKKQAASVKATKSGVESISIPPTPDNPTSPLARPPTPHPRDTTLPEAMLPLTWTRIGPVDGTVTAIVIDPKTPSTLYAGTSQDGMFKSLNRGDTWIAINNGLDHPNVIALVIDPSNPSFLYAGTEDGIYKSMDGGKSWNASNNGLTNFKISCIAIDPETSNTLYVGTFEGRVFKSINGGKNWILINANVSMPRVFTITIDSMNHSILYAGTDYEAPPENPNIELKGEEGLFKSTNDGESWSAINTTLPVHSRVTTLAIDPKDSEKVFAWVVSGAATGIYKSTDGGQNWILADTGLITYGNSVVSLIIDQLSPTTLYAGTDHYGVFKSVDGGDTWKPVNTNLISIPITTLAINPDRPNTWYAGVAWNGVLKSEDGGDNWIKTQIDLPRISVSALAFDLLEPSTIYVGSLGKLFNNAINSQIWIPREAPIGYDWVNSIVVDPAKPSNFYASAGESTLVSTDGGALWGLSIYRFNSDVRSLAIAPGSPLFAGTFDGVFKRMKDGTWNAANTGLSQTFIMDVAIDPITVTTLYAGTNASGVFKSTDNGETWKAVNDGLSNKNVVELEIDPLTPNILYAGTEGGVFKSLNGGESWKVISTGMSDTRIKVLAIHPKTPEILYAGTTSGQIYKSIDNGENWMELNIDLSKSNILTMIPDPLSADTLYVGTSFDGLIMIDSGIQ